MAAQLVVGHIVRGNMVAKGRDGVERRFGLLTVSTVMLWLAPGHGVRRRKTPPP